MNLELHRKFLANGLFDPPFALEVSDFTAGDVFDHRCLLEVASKCG